MMPALLVEKLAAPFGDAPGLSEISFAVNPGERLVLVGASGAGKTTLLKAVAGLMPKVEGRVIVAGRDVTMLPAERRELVYLHQTPLLFPHLDVAGNVAFPLRVRRVPAAERRVRIDAALRAVRLEELAERMPRTLSGGQRHRVALARALVARPAALLLDEPLAALDPGLRAEVREAILAVQRESGSAVLLVTHDLEEAGLLADRIGVLLDGRLAQVAPPAELFRRPASLAVARFLALPNEIAGMAAGGRFESPLGCFPCDPALSGEAAAVAGADGFALDPAGPIEATVLSVHHRPGGAVALVEAAGVRLQLAVPAQAPPAVGTTVKLAVAGELVVLGA